MTDLRSLVRDVPDFPSPGILFRDITPLLANPEAFRAAVFAMAAPYRGVGLSKVLGIEARGFMFGAAVARELSVGFVPVRKPGKLPGETIRASYGLEYGKVVIVDDVLATGGTAEAAASLADSLNAEVVGLTFFIELEKLGGRARLSSRRVQSVLVL
jgi:adenine phosphoribosyltransferase